MRDRKCILFRIFIRLFVVMMMVMLLAAVGRFTPEDFNAVVNGL